MPSSNVTYGYVPQTVSKSSWDNLKQLRSMNYLKNKSITLGVNHRPTRNFPVQGRSVKSTLYSVPDCQAITKKAIVERLKHAYNEKGWLNESGAKYPVEVSILKDKVLLTIDTSGSGLNRRGYRLAQGKHLSKKH